MQVHPYTKTDRRKIVVAGVAVLAMAIQTAFLCFYAEAAVVPAFLDSVISISLFVVLSYLLWYTIGFIHALQAEILLGLMVMVVWLGTSSAGQYLSEQAVGSVYCPFTYTFPFRLLAGALCWILISQWYHLQRLQEWKAERLASESLETIQEEEIADRIAVKDGVRIHIVQLNDLLYVQACGDYVTLVTLAGQYLKEQTMKSLESQLPSARFVRIHRSYIVNVEQIKRVELFGKETYHVLLKNGVALKASSSGYKLLKDQLSL